jgi:ABC-type antimicrobial peptide transport system permease subunit
MRRQGPETAPVAQMFEPLAQNAPRRAVLVVRVASGDPVALTGSIRAAVQRIDRGAAVYDIATVDARLERLTAPRRLQTWLLAAFALAALSLAGLGIYGLGHYSVSARTHEIGLRMALGAGGADIFRMIMGEGLALCGVGLGIGLAGSLWLGQAASTLLFEVTPTDPVTFLGVPLLTVLVTAGACYLPARRAMRVAPTEALRHRVG